MITPRRLAVLGIAAVIAVAAAGWFASRRTVPTDAPTGNLVLPALKARIDAVTAVRLAAKGANVTLERSGKDWIVKERDYPADTAKLRKLLLGLADLTVTEQKTRDPANYAQLGVEDAGTSATGMAIEVDTADRKFSLLAGKAAGGTGSFVRLPGDAQALLASPQIAADTDPKHWIDTALADLPADRVQALEVTPATGPAWRATRDAAKDPLALVALPKGKKQRGADVVTPVAALFTGLHMQDVRAAPAGNPPLKPRVVVRSFDGLEIDLTGREDGDHRYIRGTARATGNAAAKEAAALEGKLRGREFEIPRYKYDALYRALSDFT